MFLRVMFGIIWACEGHRTFDPRERVLEQLYPDGPLHDIDPKRRAKVPYIHHESVTQDEQHSTAYARGMDKWYAVRGGMIPFEESGLRFPDGSLPPDWRPPWTIPQKVVLKDKDVYKARFDPRGKPAKTRCVCALNQNYNEYWRVAAYRYTGYEYFAAQVEPRDYIAVVDISSFYLAIPYGKRMLKYQAFRDQRVEGRNGWKVHSRLPFGAGLSPYYASAMSAEAVDILCGRARKESARARLNRGRALRKGIGRQRPHIRMTRRQRLLARWGDKAKSCAYVDDIALAGGKPETAEAVRTLVSLLKRMGLDAVDKDKTWEPKQTQKHLGVVFCTVVEHPKGSGILVVELSLDADYKAYLVAQADDALGRKDIAGKDLPSLVGCLQWACVVMTGGPAFLAALHALKAADKRRRGGLGKDAGAVARAAAQVALLQRECRADLIWWRRHLLDPDWTGSRVLLPDRAKPVLIKSDASGEFGWGYHELAADPAKARWGQAKWTAEQLRDWEHDMATKELYPLVEALKTHGAAWRGRGLKIGFDNTGAVYAINAGRAKTEKARNVMREYGNLINKYELDVVAQWVPRELNKAADALSRQIGYKLALLAVAA